MNPIVRFAIGDVRSDHSITKDLPDPPFGCEVVDENDSIIGWLAIDSLVRGRSHGGVRLSPGVSLEELCALAHRMTLKFGFLGLAGGGAKAGVLGDPEALSTEKMLRLRQFVKAISPLIKEGYYHPAPDLGTSDAEIDNMIAVLGIKRHRAEPTREMSGFYTSLSVVAGVQAAVQHLGLNLVGLDVAVEGFGKVGAAVVSALAKAGAKIVAVSTSFGALYDPKGLNVNELMSARTAGNRFITSYRGAARLKPEELLTLPVEVLCPCAASWSINPANALGVQAHIVCPGANLPFAPGAEAILVRRGVLCLPDFVSNCGGVLGGTMEFAGVDRNTIQRFVAEKMSLWFAAWLANDKRTERLPSEFAEQKAMERFAKSKRRSESTSAFNYLFNTGLEAYRWGLIPTALVGRVSLSYFERILI